jgi:hypothetical protein
MVDAALSVAGSQAAIVGRGNACNWSQRRRAGCIYDEMNKPSLVSKG